MIWLNRYAVEGVLRDLEAGKLVVILGGGARAGADFLRAVESAGGDEAWSRVVHVNGAGRLEHRSGGRLMVGGAPSSHRGRVAGASVVIDRLGPQDRQETRDALFSLQAGGAEIVRMT